MKTALDNRYSYSDPMFPFFVEEKRVVSGSLPVAADYQIVYLEKGKTYYRNDGIQTVAAPHAMIIPHGHGATVSFAKGSVIMRLIFGQSFIEEVIIRCWDDSLFLSFNLAADSTGGIVFISLSGNDSQEISAIYNSLIVEQNNMLTMERTMIRLKFIQLLTLFYRFSLPSGSMAAECSAVWNMREVIKYVQENYSQNITLGEIASRCALNPSYFSRSFRETAGVPLFEYINRIRIQKSCILLKRSDMSIIDIAYSVGYNNISFFNRYFRKIMKMSPREYRHVSRK
ncbi:MAG: helix-turn-helix transcriptional regulator [Spirochaetales bacterium]|jgi:AraC-like DNA-binding protein|nr:helix-turn-helix transcriptional regulator [Spirochaetales bacterium]